MLRDPVLTAASPTRTIPWAGGDPVTVAVDPASADLVVFDVDGETVLTRALHPLADPASCACS